MKPDDFRAALARAGISQRAFAARSGVAVSTVNRWAQGTQPIPGWVAWVLELLGLIEPPWMIKRRAERAANRAVGIS